MRVIVIPTVTLPSEKEQETSVVVVVGGDCNTRDCAEMNMGIKKKTLIFIYLFLVCVLFLQRKTGVSFIVL